MIIAVPYEDGRVNAHFGRTEAFAIARVDGSDIADWDVRPVVSLQHDHEGLAGFLRGQDVDVILAGGMGAPMQAALKSAGFELFCGVDGPARGAVEAYLRGEIEQSDSTCGHHHG